MAKDKQTWLGRCLSWGWFVLGLVVWGLFLDFEKIGLIGVNS